VYSYKLKNNIVKFPGGFFTFMKQKKKMAGKKSATVAGGRKNLLQALIATNIPVRLMTGFVVQGQI